jgi:hypothetical protein
LIEEDKTTFPQNSAVFTTEHLSAITFLVFTKSYFCGVELRKKILFGFQPTATHSSPKTASS